MVNVNKLKGKIVENGMTVNGLADKIEIDRSTLYRKLNAKGEKITIKEAQSIVTALHLTSQEAVDIFFTLNVA